MPCNKLLSQSGKWTHYESELTSSSIWRMLTSGAIPALGDRAKLPELNDSGCEAGPTGISRNQIPCHQECAAFATKRTPSAVQTRLTVSNRGALPGRNAL